MTTLVENPYFRWLNLTHGHWLHMANEANPAAFYRMLEMYYHNNGVYDELRRFAIDQAITTEAMKGFRNPAHRVVEFYANKMWPGQLPDALPIVAKNKRIVEPIQQVWKWSNFSSKKQLVARWFALFGDMFTKVATSGRGPDGRATRVYMQSIKPEHVTKFELSERGFIEWIRIDVPMEEELDDGRTREWWWTEVWDEALGTMTVWEHDKTPKEPIARLGSPSIADTLESFGIDFIPIVYAPFIDVGADRGSGAFSHALDKVDEANRQATRLHQLLFRYNKPVWAASAGGADGSGRPLPPPKVSGSSIQGADIDVPSEPILSLPGASKIEALIPNISYESALMILDAQMKELEYDLPELAYYRMRDITRSDLSGRAVRMLLSDAVDKVVEARGNAEAALARAHAMALTLGMVNGLFGDLGNFDAGDFEHTFEERDVIPTAGTEQAEEAKAWQTAGVNITTSLKKVGWSEADLKAEEADAKAREDRDAVQAKGNVRPGQAAGQVDSAKVPQDDSGS